MATNPAGKGTKTIGINMKMEMARESGQANWAPMAAGKP